MLDVAPLVGEKHARYYNVRSRRWFQPHNQVHASLCRTGLSRSLLGALAAACEESNRAGDPFVDLRLWSKHGGAFLLAPYSGCSIGIKGMPGRGGAGKSHAWNAFPFKDPGMGTLTSWIGDDALEYAKFADMNLVTS